MIDIHQSKEVTEKLPSALSFSTEQLKNRKMMTCISRREETHEDSQHFISVGKHM